MGCFDVGVGVRWFAWCVGKLLFWLVGVLLVEGSCFWVEIAVVCVYRLL